MQQSVRFSVRTLMIVMTVLCLALPWLPSLLHSLSDREPTYSMFVLICPLLVLSVGWFVGVVVFHSYGFWARTFAARVVFALILIFVALPTAYLIWARHRWCNLSPHEIDRQLPYPDPLLLQIHNWLDKRNPSPGFIKIHGEYYTLWSILDRTVLAVVSVCGFFLGGLAPNLPKRIRGAGVSIWKVSTRVLKSLLNGRKKT